MCVCTSPKLDGQKIVDSYKISTPHLPTIYPRSESHSNVRHETSPHTHQAHVGTLTVAHGLPRAFETFCQAWMCAALFRQTQ
ncbi:hypothetical protein BDR05DRAFT_958685 [Suillus weaverae]|nr:hypothetical protein BDR05DRAFT_958685 [Suillus weaverae]